MKNICTFSLSIFIVFVQKHADMSFINANNLANSSIWCLLDAFNAILNRCCAVVVGKVALVKSIAGYRNMCCSHSVCQLLSVRLALLHSPRLMPSFLHTIFDVGPLFLRRRPQCNYCTEISKKNDLYVFTCSHYENVRENLFNLFYFSFVCVCVCLVCATVVVCRRLVETRIEREINRNRNGNNKYYECYVVANVCARLGVIKWYTYQIKQLYTNTRGPHSHTHMQSCTGTHIRNAHFWRVRYLVVSSFFLLFYSFR